MRPAAGIFATHEIETSSVRRGFVGQEVITVENNDMELNIHFNKCEEGENGKWQTGQQLRTA